MVAKKVNPNPKAVIVVNGLEFADALSASSLIGVLDDTTIILTDPKTLSKEAEEYLINDSVEKVYILGGNNAVSKTVENQILQKKHGGATARRVTTSSSGVGLDPTDVD